MDYLKDMIKSLDNEYAGIAGDGLVGDNTTFIDTGSYSFNALLSGSIYGGLPSNKITALAGETSTGKTFFALGICKNFMDTDPEAGIIYFETEGALTRSILEERGIDTRRFVIVPVTTIQEFRTQAVKILDNHNAVAKKSRKPIMFCLDSLGMLSTEKEVNDVSEGKDVRDMTRSQLVRGAFRVLSLKMAKLDVPMIVTNHTYDVIGAYMPTKEMGGGGGLKYAASTIVFLGKAKDRDGKEIIGNIIRCTAQKSRFTKEQSKVEAKLSFSKGLDRYWQLADFACDAGIWIATGGRIDTGVTGKAFGKTIYNDPQKFFTQDVLEKIDLYCKKRFKYGSEEEEQTVIYEEMPEDDATAE
jgi:RecA/RadA recombinase